MKFTETEGAARKEKIDYYELKFGKNEFRMFGEVLPRYVYWKPHPNSGKGIPVENLAFDRDAEAFLNEEKDWVAHYFPEVKSQWSYSILVIDPKDDTIKVLTLKKKMFQQIKDMIEHLGDPTDPDEGWLCVVKKTKTGSNKFNVEYTVDQLACKKLPLTDAQKEIIAEHKTIDKMLKRMTADEQHEMIKRIWFKEEETEEQSENDVDEEVTNELDEDIFE